MKKKKPALNTKEREILRIIHKEAGSMSPNEISQKTGISYVTVRKYLKKMVKEGVLIEV
ncbi:hypothetical protein LCGC14_0844200 [marine sediment metagenome]|uniref:Winged helix-turn-helix transcriptional regulator n=1 Tax=marine sediment metagenome TaxID=412755 RepID=A0A0F9PCB4_9ZZZZ